MRRAARPKVSPSSVSRRLRVVRTSSRTPSRASIRATTRLTADGVRPKAARRGREAALPHDGEEDRHVARPVEARPRHS